MKTHRCKHRTGITPIAQCILALALAALPLSAPAAELVGNIRVTSKGLFGAAAGGHVPGGVSVAAIPLDGQALPGVAPQTHRIVIHDKAFDPVFLTVRTGDSLEFVNRDRVYHEIFSLSRILPFDVRLGKPGDTMESDVERVARFPRAGTWHVFCRINNSMYARVDVVDTPYIQSLPAGGEFRFAGLAGGRWRLRVAALGSEVMQFDTVAITSPPPLHIDLPVRGSQVARGADADSKFELHTVERLYPGH